MARSNFTTNNLSGTVTGAVVQAGQAHNVTIMLPSPVEPVVPHELPPQRGHFVDRAEDTRRLTDMLINRPEPFPGVAVLIGPHGIGKTALVRQWGALHVERFPAGQFYADLGCAGTSPDTITDFLASWLINSGVPAGAVPAGMAARSALWRTLTHDRAVLVVIDGAEPTADLRPLLPASPSSVTLITTRHELPLLIADGARVHRVAQLPDDAALKLLETFTTDTSEGIDTDALHQLVRACDGHPLTIRLAGARVALNSGRPIADVLDDASRSHPSRTGTTTLERILMATTGEDLTDHAGILLDLLCEVPLPEHAVSVDITVGEASALLGTSGNENDLAVAAVDELHQHNLLEPTGHPDRYVLPPAVRTAHRPRRLGADIVEAALRRLALHHLHKIASAVATTEPRKKRYTGLDEATLPRFPDRDSALAWFRAERPKILALFQLSADREWDDITIPLSCVLWVCLSST